MPTVSYSHLDRRVIIAAVAIGVAYGVAARFVFGISELETTLVIMGISFIFIVPLVIGYLTIHFMPAGTGSWGTWILLPWAATTLTMIATMLLAMEGAICLTICIPAFFVMSSIGGIIAGLVRQNVDAASTRGMMLASLVILPFVLSPFEQQYDPATDYRIVRNRIEIAATPEKIWEQIREVPPIRADELERSFSHTIGFPRPIEARLYGEGVGAVRHATFEGGVLFRETVTAWHPDSLLSFTIAPDSGIPATTFDDHVVVGGEYFDVLEGTYRIERIAPGRCILHLSSRQRVSTRFNAYTALWTSYFMSDIQESILEVISKRARG